MKVDIQLSDEQEREIIWDGCKEELQLGISVSTMTRKPYVCAYLFNYRDGTDFEQAVQKRRFATFVGDYIRDHIGFCYDSTDDSEEKTELRQDLVDLINDLNDCLSVARKRLSTMSA